MTLTPDEVEPVDPARCAHLWVLGVFGQPVREVAVCIKCHAMRDNALKDQSRGDPTPAHGDG